ncbi:1032_t:CDS:2 [Entrophospora sp. SA101]|nr:1032_t:CDS:2 [Entrophospora sp. SA101]
MLKEKTRSQLTEELRKHWENNESEKKGKKNELEDTVEIMRLLEEEIIKYRQCHHHWANEKGDEVDDKCSNVQPEDIEKKALSELSSIKERITTGELNLNELRQAYKIMAYCQGCGGTGAYPRNYESPNGTSHCAKCGKYSNVYHYIYDKDTDKLTQSFDNASNPNKHHFREWEKEQKCMCRKCGKKGFGGYIYKKGNEGNFYERFCSKLEEQLAKLNVPTICQECKKSGTAAEMDWHNPNVNDGTGEKSYYQDAKKTKEKPVSSNSSANNRNDSPNQPSPTNNSPFSFNPPSEGTNSNGTSYLDCPFCQKRVYSEEECNQHLQDSLDCQKKQEIMKPIAEKIENNESILDVKVDDLGLNQEMTITLKAVQRIQRGEKVNIDQLNISEEAKKQLRNIKSLKDYRREESNSDPKKKF